MDAKEIKPGVIRPAGHYRHELKYNITYWQYLQLRSRFRQVMKTDPHTEADGTYQIRSIYFDNVQDKALREKVNGVAKREKFRVRYYNDNFTQITLEKKIKDNDLCMKVSAGLKEAECRMLLAGNLEWMRNHPSSLVQELYGKMKYQQLRPRVLVSYTREPYIYAAGNVRITFDWNVRTTMYHQKFLEEKVYDVEAVQCPGEMIMEVKYEEYDEAANLLVEVVQLRAESVSGQLDGTIPSTDEGQQQDSSSLIDGSDIDLSIMGSFSGGGGGNDGPGDEIGFAGGNGGPGNENGPGGNGGFAGNPPQTSDAEADTQTSGEKDVLQD